MEETTNNDQTTKNVEINEEEQKTHENNKDQKDQNNQEITEKKIINLDDAMDQDNIIIFSSEILIFKKKNF